MKRALLILAGFMLVAGVAASTPNAWAGAKSHPSGVSRVHQLSSRGTLESIAPDIIQEFCSNEGAGYCMNDWNGDHNQGAPIKMYYGGSSNEEFELQAINPCNSSPDPDDVTETCPFVVGSGLNAKYDGSLIFQLYYPAANKCIGTSSAGNGILTGCNSPAGTGGGDGTILISPDAGPFVNDDPIIDKYWTNQSPGTIEQYLCGLGFEQPLTLAATNFSTACEWQNQT